MTAQLSLAYAAVIFSRQSTSQLVRVHNVNENVIVSVDDQVLPQPVARAFERCIHSHTAILLPRH